MSIAANRSTLGDSNALVPLGWGDVLRRWDVWNTVQGLEFIPEHMVGSILVHYQPRDVYLRPLHCPVKATAAEWEIWNRTH